MKYFLLIILAAAITLSSCKDDIAISETTSSVQQIGKCQGSGLGKLSADSCFSYSFNKNLMLDFCVTGNCCPDSNRFMFRSHVLNDSIKIYVKDIAPNLCRCVCEYHVRASFESVHLDKYIIFCVQEGSSSSKILYNKVVRRE